MKQFMKKGLFMPKNIPGLGVGWGHVRWVGYVGVGGSCRGG